MAQSAKEKKKILKKKTLGTVDKTVGDYGNHPFFVKKANEAKNLLVTVGLPEEIKEKHNL